MRIVKGMLVGVFILLGILLLSSVDKGFETFAQDRIVVNVTLFADMRAVVEKVPNTTVLNSPQGDQVGVPYGETEKYVQIFRTNPEVAYVGKVSVTPSFSWKKYRYEIGKQLQQYTQGSFGSLIYPSSRPIDPPREYSINSQLGSMIERSMSYLVPGLLLGCVLGYGFSLLAVWKPRLGKWLDGAHAVLLGMPDFFIVVLLQMGAILVAKAAGHKVLTVMQFGDDTPFLIPFLAIVILPAALLYGALRIAVAREWEEGYIKTAYAKGLSRSKVIFVHILRNTMTDLLAILPRTVSVAVTSLVVAEVMCAIFGLGGYSISPKLKSVTALPATCAILAGVVMLTHLLSAVLRKRLVVDTKEGA
jgi:oligopeptide transport system permease protein